MPPHFPFMKLEEVQQAMNPVTGMTGVARLTKYKSNKAFNCTIRIEINVNKYGMQFFTYA